MPSESGDMKVLGNFRQLIDQVSADPGYNPSNPLLAKAALEAQHAAASAAVQSISAKLAPYRIAVSERLLAFEAMSELITRSRNMLKASGASREILEDVDTVFRKLMGRRKSSKTGDGKTATANPSAPSDKAETPQKEAATSHSASQMSFDNRLGNLNAYVDLLMNVPSYNPNETDLKAASLKALAASLKAKNDAVSSTFVQVSQARGQRDELLYSGANSVVSTALLVKSYVSAALGTKSQLHKQIKGLKFERQRQN